MLLLGSPSVRGVWHHNSGNLSAVLFGGQQNRAVLGSMFVRLFALCTAIRAKPILQGIGPEFTTVEP